MNVAIFVLLTNHLRIGFACVMCIEDEAADLRQYANQYAKAFLSGQALSPTASFLVFPRTAIIHQKKESLLTEFTL